MLFYAVCAVFFSAGIGAMWAAVRHARTSTHVETGRWFTIGLMMAAASAAIAFMSANNYF